MCRIIKTTLLILLLSISSISFAQFKVVGYLVNWSNFTGGASAIDGSVVTHVNIAFLNPTNAAGDLGPTTGLSTVVTTLHGKNVKVLASLGGAGAYTSFTNWPTLLQPANRTAFVAKIVQFVNDYNLDGVDVDLEGNDVDGNYAGFVNDLDAAMPSGKLVTCAIGTWFGNKISTATLKKFDWVNDMAYDAYGTWTGPGEHSTYSFAESDLDYWRSKGVSKDSLVLGVPFYGYYWNTSNSSLGYCNILASYPRAEFQDTIIYNNGKGFLSFNSATTIKNKMALATEKANGIMYWTSQFDCVSTNPKSLISSIKSVITNSPGNIAPTVSMNGPANNSVYTEADTIPLTALANDVDGSISSVHFYRGTTSANMVKIGEASTDPYSVDAIQLAPGTYKIHAKAFDNVPALKNSDTITVVVNPVSVQQPYKGVIQIPGKIEIENFDIGSNLGYYDTDAANSGGAYRSTRVDIEKTQDAGGGYDVGWTNAGEWLEYTVNVTEDGPYDFEIRLATTTTAKTLSILIDGINVTGTVTAPNTGGWQLWQTVTVNNITLTAGQKVMRIAMTTGGYNLNYVNVKKSIVAGIFSSSALKGGLDIYPNPFTDNANIRIDLPGAGQTKVTLFNTAGKEIRVLHNGFMKEGANSISLSGSDIPSGFYICQVVQEDKVVTAGVVKE